MAQQQPLEVLRRVKGEYIEMPGLRLTTAQAQRLLRQTAWPVGPRTSSAEITPVASGPSPPGAPQLGVSAGTVAGGVTRSVLQSHTEMPPEANLCARWM